VKKEEKRQTMAAKKLVDDSYIELILMHTAETNKERKVIIKNKQNYLKMGVAIFQVPEI